MKRWIAPIVIGWIVFFMPLVAQASDDVRLVIYDDVQEVQQVAKTLQIEVEEVYERAGITVIRADEERLDAFRTTLPRAILQTERHYESNAAEEQELFSAPLIQATRSNTYPYKGRGVRVAVVDSGVDTKHPDLHVHGGYCVHGVNCTQYRLPYCDNNGHGTHVAGIIAARENGQGLVGIAPEVELYAVKAMNEFGLGTTRGLVDAVNWTRENKMDIVNLSINTPKSDLALKKVLEEAYRAGVLFVGSAGNNGLEQDPSVTYPAKYDTVIAVSALGDTMRKLPKSAYGPEIEFTAPGSKIFSTYPFEWDFVDGKEDGYTRMSGTSMAAPHVTGVLALYRERFPEMTNVELRQHLRRTAKAIGDESEKTHFGYGLVQYRKDVKGSVPLDVKATKGKAVIQPKDAVLELYADGRPLKKELEGYIAYGVAGLKAIDVESLSLHERQYVQIGEPYYKDVTNNQRFAYAVGYLSAHDQLDGFPDGTFRPHSKLTRAEAVLLIARALQLDVADKETEFEDVSEKSKAAGHIAAAVKAGIISGYPDGTFRPSVPMTRAEMAIVLTRAFDLTLDRPVKIKDVHEWMKGYEAIQTLVQHKIAGGYLDGTFRPGAAMTRGDFAIFLARTQEPDFR